MALFEKSNACCKLIRQKSFMFKLTLLKAKCILVVIIHNCESFKVKPSIQYSFYTFLWILSMQIYIFPYKYIF